MPYGLEFHRQEENPVAHWLWRIATAVQDAEEFGDESTNVALDESTSMLYRHFLHHAPWYRKKVEQMNADGKQATTALDHARLALDQAREIAKDKAPNDQQTVAALQAIYEAVIKDLGTARAEADGEVDSI